MIDPSTIEIVQLGRVRVPILPSLLSPLIANGIRKGWYERDERRAIEAAVRNGDRVLDLGGGLGVCSATAATMASVRRLTVVEANPNLMDVIRLTMTLNGVVDFELIWAAVSTSPAKTTHLQVGEHYWSAMEASSPAAGALEVPILSPSTILSLSKPDVLICDIEGNEQGLIDAADLSGVRSLIVEFHPNLYGTTVMEKLDAKLCKDGFRRQTKWTASERPQVHHYEKLSGTRPVGERLTVE